jgi:hypothetical protein
MNEHGRFREPDKNLNSIGTEDEKGRCCFYGDWQESSNGKY